MNLGILEGLSKNDRFKDECSRKAASWALAVGHDSKTPASTKIIRISLIPRTFKKDLYDKVVSLGPMFNKLVDNVSMDLDWLNHAHEGTVPISTRFYSFLDVIHADGFIARLIQAANSVYRGPRGKDISEDIRLCLHRNDFMTTDGDSRILQVEINTISVGFAGMIENLSVLHKSNRAQFYPDIKGTFPAGNPCSSFARAMSEAIEAHNSKWNRCGSTVLFVVEDGERNFVDQYALEYRLNHNHNISVLRRSLGELVDLVEFDSGRFLHVEGVEIPLVYFRSGYDPKHYPSEKEWDVRELIEKSISVKAPSILAQLAGTKKVQQLWFRDNGQILHRFGLTSDEIKEVKSVFALQCDPSVDTETRQAAILTPEGWILKPQREGGGHNLHGDDLREALSTMTSDELSQFVLMEKMVPTPSPALVIDGQATFDAGRIVPLIIPEAIGELGIFSYYIPQRNFNEVCGHLVRTKDKTTREGGVNIGHAFLDTVVLIE